MFGFCKKKDKIQKKEQVEVLVITEERKEELLRIISSKQKEVNELSKGEQSKIYEEIGLAFNELGEEDNAISALEQSIQLKKNIGDGYKALLKLYNKKRAEAAKANDEELLQLYLRKMDQMLQVSKDITRGL